MGQAKFLVDILDSNLEELLAHDLYTANLPRPIALYLRILINYLKADTAELTENLSLLNELVEKHPEDLELKGIYFCSQIREAIRNNSLSEESLSSFTNVSNIPAPWIYELNLVLGLAYMRLNEFEKSANYFRLSYETFSAYGCRRKALIAYQNHVVSKLNLNPNKSYLAEWSFLAKVAKKEKVTSMEGGALINLSREYQNIGSHHPALKAINEALKCLSESIGTYQYYLALFQRCDLLLDLGMNGEALETFQEAKLCPFGELKPSLEILERKMNPDKTLSNIALPESLPWQERLNQLKKGENGKRASNLVQQLIAELEREPQDRFSLIERLYPENIPFDVKENRFKVLLSKVRKMHPGLIIKEGALYRIEMTNQWLKKKIS